MEETTAASFRERLIPGWQAFASALAFVALVSVAYGAVLGPAIGIALFVAGGLLACLVIVFASPVVLAGQAGISVGRAQLPRTVIGEVTVLERDDVARLRGPQGEATAYAVLRPTRSRRGVRIAVADPHDPHPAWLVTSRRPEALRAALE